MKRINEAFANLPIGAQYVADAQAVAVGKIVDDGNGVKALDYHPGYNRHAAYFDLMAAGREPSCDLSSDAPGQAVNAKIQFRHYGPGVQGVVMDVVVKLASTGQDRIRLGYDGTSWYCYVCAPARIVAAGSWSLAKPLTEYLHTFSLAVRHGRIVGQFDEEPGFSIPYTVPSWAPPGTQTAAVLLESSASWGIRFRAVGVAVQN